MVNEVVHERIQALVDEDRLDEALALSDQLDSIPVEQFDAKLEQAPVDDEAVSDADLASIQAVLRVRGLPDAGSRRAG